MSTSPTAPLSAKSTVQNAAVAASRPGPPTVPDYDLLRRISGGAYGEVWLARSQATGALRAAKIVWRHTFEDARPFLREFEGIQKFERISRAHASQLALFHIGRNDAEGYFYYVMELADAMSNTRAEDQKLKEFPGPKVKSSPGLAPAGPSGLGPVDADSYVPRTLRAELALGRLAVERVLEIGLALAEALGHLHRHGLVHRDVKPSNVIFVNGRPKLADIGLVTDASDRCSLVGTEGYLPPEGPGTPQADIFALGKVLYEAATGLDRRDFPKLPGTARSWTDAKRLYELNEILLKACATAPEERYLSAEAILSELTLLGSGKSVRRKRALDAGWSAGKKVGAILIALALASGLLSIVPRASWRHQASSDGPDSTNLEANAVCDKALKILRGDNYSEFKNIYTYLNQAIELDPNFARPYVGLLELQTREDVAGLPAQTAEAKRSLTQHLQQLAPKLGATYCAQSILAYFQGNLPDALRYSKAAVKTDPNYELGHTFYAWLLLCCGWPEQARAETEISRKISPSKTIIYRALGNIEYVERHYPEAIQCYTNAIRWEPHHFAPYGLIGESCMAMGDYTNALDWFERGDLVAGKDENAARRHYAALRAALDAGGIPGYWEQEWKWAGSSRYGSAYWKAVIQLNMGNTNEALGWLEKSIKNWAQNRSEPEWAHGLLYDHYWDGLHADERFRHLLEEAGFSKVMPH